jgi:hypothetical protein
MAIAKITEVCLYTSSVLNPLECHAAKAWFDHSGIKYQWLDYNDIDQLPEVTKALNTWWKRKTVSQWPFVVYRYFEYDDGDPAEPLISDFVEGLENIQTQLPQIVGSAETPWT